MNKRKIKNIAGDGIFANNADWSFGGKTPKSFTSHVIKSVPLYECGHEAVLDLSDFFVKEDSICYELGVSTAVLLGKLSKRHKKSVKWYGIDLQQSMIDQAKVEIKKNNINNKNLKLICDDITTYDFFTHRYDSKLLHNSIHTSKT